MEFNSTDPYGAFDPESNLFRMGVAKRDFAEIYTSLNQDQIIAFAVSVFLDDADMAQAVIDSANVDLPADPPIDAQATSKKKKTKKKVASK